FSIFIENKFIHFSYIMPTYLLHIPKTGGSNLKHCLKSMKSFPFLLCNHDKTLVKSTSQDRFIFFVRSPVTRFVSGFLSRLREGRPLNNYPHTVEEKVT